MITVSSDPAARRRLERAREKAIVERSEMAAKLRVRPDYHPTWEYFLERLSDTPNDAQARTGCQPVFTLCVQTPLEILHALGLMPWRIFDGHVSHDRLAARDLPTLACPLLRAAAGAFLTESLSCPDSLPTIIPATCDWAARFPDMMTLAGLTPSQQLFYLDLPRLKEHPESRSRWAGEIHRLLDFLETTAKRRLTAKALSASMAVYQRAWSVFGRLIDRRREGGLSAPLFFLAANAFGRDAPEPWTQAIEAVLSALSLGGSLTVPENTPGKRPRIFLSGAPVYFPDFKLPLLLEAAGLTVVGDDLCSSERIFPGATFARDFSLPGLATALAERYHQGCLCPTFCGNDRRASALLQRSEEIDGVVYHVLKGCHPHDLDSLSMERTTRTHDLRFLRLETDHAAEDGAGLFTRLEAFAASLRDGNT